jgi:broad specificity phosphatase PhoE
MRLILVRPGEPAGEPKGKQGVDHSDFIAREIGSVVSRTLPAEAVYTGTNPLAAETARIISDGLGVAAPIENNAFDTATVDSSPGDIESLRSRAWAAAESLQEQHSADCTIILVAEELAIRLLVCHALAIPSSEIQRFRIDPASLTTLDFRLQPQRRTILAGLNETCHLEKEQVTGNE